MSVNFNVRQLKQTATDNHCLIKVVPILCRWLKPTVTLHIIFLSKIMFYAF